MLKVHQGLIFIKEKHHNSTILIHKQIDKVNKIINNF